MDAVLTTEHPQDASPPRHAALSDVALTAPVPGRAESADAIHVSAVVIRNSDGEVLTVRKSGTDRFMLPGGKPEPGETPVQTAVRECAEELSVELWPEDLRELGTFHAAAANEPGRLVTGEIFLHDAAPAAVDAAPASEIAELRWLSPAAEPMPEDLAPLLAEEVLPALKGEETRA
ncbi:NUDIX domain-containing protein [Actinocorallia glomerata]|uniref:NUDIX domain-containing protein n=2 Tax=Actinomycetes TaxID=1760 RepID=A0ABP6LQT9_9MICC